MENKKKLKNEKTQITFSPSSSSETNESIDEGSHGK